MMRDNTVTPVLINEASRWNSMDAQLLRLLSISDAKVTKLHRKTRHKRAAITYIIHGNVLHLPDFWLLSQVEHFKAFGNKFDQVTKGTHLSNVIFHALLKRKKPREPWIQLLIVLKWAFSLMWRQLHTQIAYFSLCVTQVSSQHETNWIFLPGDF